MLRGALLAALLVFAGSTAAAGQWGLLGVGKGTSASSAYVGPGDIVSGATAWYGLRAYSAAVAATGTQKAVRVRRSSDNAEQDILILTTGALDTASADTFCNATTCFVTTAHDQSGNTRNATQATAAQQPQLSFSVIGSLPCMQFNNASSQRLATASITVAQPWSVSHVANRTGSTTSVSSIVSDPTNSTFFATTPVISLYAGSGSGLAGPAAADSAFHATQAVANGASGAVSTDGSTNTGNPGSNSFNGALWIGGQSGISRYLTGYICEAGLWPAAFSAGERTSLNTNQHAYWGF